MSPFEAHFGRLPKTEFKILSDRFLRNSGRLDKEHLERSALTASQLKKRIDQSRDSLKIVRKGQNSRDVSPLFKQQGDSAQDRARARALKELLEANARWNQTRRDTSANDLRRTVEETSTINPELRKEMLYSWERGFIEDKPEDIVSERQWSPILLRKDEGRKSGEALTKPLKGKVVAEAPSTIKRILDPVEAHQKFQDSPTVVTSKEIVQGGGLNLAVKRAKPNMAGPFTKTSKIKGGTGAKDSQQTILQNKCAATAVEE